MANARQWHRDGSRKAETAVRVQGVMRMTNGNVRVSMREHGDVGRTETVEMTPEEAREVFAQFVRVMGEVA